MAHAEVAEERRRYQHLFQYAPDAYLLTDLSGIIREANHSAAHLLGVQPRFLVGKTLVSFVAAEDRAPAARRDRPLALEPAAKSLELRLQPRRRRAVRRLAHAVRGPGRAAGQGVRCPVAGARHLRPTASSPTSSGSARRRPAARPRRAKPTPTTCRSSRASACWPAASRTTSTICFTSSWATPTCPAPRPRRVAGARTSGRGGAGHPARRRAHPAAPGLQRPGRRREPAARSVARGARNGAPCSGPRCPSRPRSSGTSRPTLPAGHRRSDPAPSDRDEPHHQRLRRARRGTRHDHAPHRRASRDSERPTKRRDLVFLEVSDTGCGMDSGTLQRIFDPFFSTKFTGRGLGLAAVMGIVESHQGHVRIRTAPGEGTSFRVVLPAVAGAADVAPRRRSGAGWRGRGTVLVVEDEEGVREVVGRMLERLGFHVLPAADGLDAIHLLDEHEADVTAVMLDLSMPRMGGRRPAPPPPALARAARGPHERLHRAGGGLQDPRAPRRSRRIPPEALPARGPEQRPPSVSQSAIA